MLLLPLAAIMLLAGAAAAPGEPAPSPRRTQPRMITPPTRFDLATPARAVRVERSSRVERLAILTFGQPEPAPTTRYSSAGVAMGLGAAAVDNDRFDLRALRLEQGRGGRMRGPFDAGLRLRLTGGRRSMQADVGLTGGVAGAIGNALKN
jgi:hypothetical protein